MMAGFSFNDCKRIANVVRKFETTIDGSPRGNGPNIPVGTVKPFVLDEDLRTGDKATATLRFPSGSSFTDGPDDIFIHAGDMPSGKKIPSGTAIWAVKYEEWFVLSSWACVEDDAEPEE